jgi:hypothetical protein
MALVMETTFLFIYLFIYLFICLSIKTYDFHGGGNEDDIFAECCAVQFGRYAQSFGKAPFLHL